MYKITDSEALAQVTIIYEGCEIAVLKGDDRKCFLDDMAACNGNQDLINMLCAEVVKPELIELKKKAIELLGDCQDLCTEENADTFNTDYEQGWVDGYKYLIDNVNNISFEVYSLIIQHCQDVIEQHGGQANE